MVDLHIHSNFSDGTCTVEEIVDKIIDKNIKYFSITDHDTIEGIRYLINSHNLISRLKNNDILFVKGVEFSGIIDGEKIHLLGYDYDENNIDINNTIQLGAQKRKSKYLLRIHALKEQLGIEFSEESLNEMSQLDYVGKPIMANYLVKDGVFKNRDIAIINAIDKLKLNPMETRIDANIIISSVNNAGGFVVWAHPLGGIHEKRISFKKLEEIIQKLIPIGLKGLECYYNLYTNEESQRLIEIAKKYNLLISAGSDFHGKNKDAQIGEVLNLDIYDATSGVTILNYLDGTLL